MVTKLKTIGWSLQVCVKTGSVQAVNRDSKENNVGYDNEYDDMQLKYSYFNRHNRWNA